MSRPIIRKLFLDVHMGMGHEGLAEIAKEAKVSLNALAGNDLLMFINRKGDKLKVLGANGKVVAYLKLPNGEPIMKEALQYIPHTFGSDGFDYNRACETALTKRIGHSLQ